MKTLKLMLSTTILASMVMASTAHARGFNGDFLAPFFEGGVIDLCGDLHKNDYTEKTDFSVLSTLIPLDVGQIVLNEYEIFNSDWYLNGVMEQPNSSLNEYDLDQFLNSINK